MANIVKLKNPSTVNGVEISEIKVRRPKVKDTSAARAASKDEAAQEVALLANLADLAPTDIEELDMVDYKACQKVLAGFFG